MDTIAETNSWFMQHAVEAVKRGDIEELRTLLRYCDTAQLAELLWGAVYLESYDIAKLLVLSGANVNQHGDPSTTLLHVVAKQSKDLPIVYFAKLIIAHGAVVNAVDSQKLTALYYAVRLGKVELAEALIESGAELENANTDGETILHTAADDDENDRLVPLLLHHGADAKARDDYGQNALHFLAKSEKPSLKAATLLLKGGTPLDGKNVMGNDTPLHCAARAGHEKLAKLFLERGADVNAEKMMGRSPLYEAVVHRNFSMVRLLINQGANIHARTRNGESAIHAACESGYKPVISLLLELGADLNAKNEYQKTPLAVMDNARMSPAMEVIIKHLAILRSIESPVEEQNMAILRENQLWQSFYDKCMEEIATMSKTALHNGYSFWCIFKKNEYKLALLSKNPGFVPAYKARNRKDTFPLYAQNMDRLVKNAETVKDRLCAQESVLYSALRQHLPHNIIRKIAYFKY